MTHFDNRRITRTHRLPQQKPFQIQWWMCQYVTPFQLMVVVVVVAAAAAAAAVVVVVVVVVAAVVVSIDWVKAQYHRGVRKCTKC